jgi:hypothetical protein
LEVFWGHSDQNWRPCGPQKILTAHMIMYDNWLLLMYDYWLYDYFALLFGAEGPGTE